MTQPITNIVDDKARLLEQNLGDIEDRAKEGRNEVAKMLAFMDGLSMHDTPLNKILMKYRVSAEEADSQFKAVLYLADAIRKDQRKL